MVGQLLLLEAREAGGLDQGQRLVGLDFAANLRHQARDEATQKEGAGKPIILLAKFSNSDK